MGTHVSQQPTLATFLKILKVLKIHVEREGGVRAIALNYYTILIIVLIFNCIKIRHVMLK